MTWQSGWIVKRIEWRPRAEQDVADAALWFARQGGLVLGERFIATVDATLLRIAACPGAGSARHAWVSDDLPVPLRFVILPVFDRYLVYYLDLPDRVDILRVWDTSRGLDALMDQTP